MFMSLIKFSMMHKNKCGTVKNPIKSCDILQQNQFHRNLHHEHYQGKYYFQKLLIISSGFFGFCFFLLILCFSIFFFFFCKIKVIFPQITGLICFLFAYGWALNGANNIPSRSNADNVVEEPSELGNTINLRVNEISIKKSKFCSV